MSKQQKTPATQTVVNTTQLPAWVDSAGQANLATANKVADNLQQPYNGNLVAPLNQDQLGAFSQTRNAATMSQPTFGQAQQGAAGAINYNPGTISANSVTAQSFPGANLSAYLNPQTDLVESRALNALDLQRQRALSQIGSDAAKAQAFGGSRQGVMEGVTNAEAARAAGDLSANLRNQAFNQAAGLQQADANRALTADQANQAAALQAARANQDAGLSANQQQILASNTLGQLAYQGQNSALQGASALQAAGNAQQAQDAALLQQQANNYESARTFPLEQLNIKMNALGLTPYGKTSTTVGPSNQQQSNPIMAGLGGAMSGLSIASSLGASAGSAGSWMGGGAGALLGLLSASDDTLKTDKQKVGKDPETGIDLYAYRYKGDPKSYPKVVGPMAQDVEKVAPDQVTALPGGGKKAVNLGFGPMKRAFKPTESGPARTPRRVNGLSGGLGMVGR